MSLCLIGLTHTATGEPATGRWRATLKTPGGELPFELDFERSGDEWVTWLVNGEERARVPQTTVTGTEITLDIDHYDSRLTGKIMGDGSRIEGIWRKRRSTTWASMQFVAEAGQRPRFPAGKHPSATQTRIDVTGRWSVRFSGSDEPAVGLFDVDPDGSVRGTFLTTTGDYRYLAGNVHSQRLFLSCFDGAHAFLFVARMEPNGSLKGGFWSGNWWHETWTAHRDSTAQIPSGFDQVRYANSLNLASIKFPDLDGRLRSLADPEFAGKAMIVEVFGSWCPNCHDAAELLVDLYNRYHDRGLSVVGLAYELTGDLKRDIAQVRRFKKRHNIEHPLLIAGQSDKIKASKSLPFLDRVRSYPTTIFLQSDGSVAAVYSGFSGPATGQAHADLRTEFERLIKTLLDAP